MWQFHSQTCGDGGSSEGWATCELQKKYHEKLNDSLVITLSKSIPFQQTVHYTV